MTHTSGHILLATSRSHPYTLLAPSRSYHHLLLATSRSHPYTLLAPSRSYHNLLLATSRSHPYTLLAPSRSYHHILLATSRSHPYILLAPSRASARTGNLHKQRQFLANLVLPLLGTWHLVLAHYALVRPGGLALGTWFLHTTLS